MFILAGKLFFILLTLNWVFAPKDYSQVKGINTSSNLSIKQFNTSNSLTSLRPIQRDMQISNLKKYISPTPSKSKSIKTMNSGTISNSSSNVGLSLISQINDFRSSKGLTPFQTDGYTCAFAVIRAGEITGNFSHDGFRTRIDSKSLPYPSYTGVSENIAMNPDPNNVVKGWIESSGHNANLSRSDKYACVAKNGNYYVFVSWNP